MKYIVQFFSYFVIYCLLLLSLFSGILICLIVIIMIIYNHIYIVIIDIMLSYIYTFILAFYLIFMKSFWKINATKSLRYFAACEHLRVFVKTSPAGRRILPLDWEGRIRSEGWDDGDTVYTPEWTNGWKIRHLVVSVDVSPFPGGDIFSFSR